MSKMDCGSKLSATRIHYVCVLQELLQIILLLANTVLAALDILLNYLQIGSICQFIYGNDDSIINNMNEVHGNI